MSCICCKYGHHSHLICEQGDVHHLLAAECSSVAVQLLLFPLILPRLQSIISWMRASPHKSKSSHTPFEVCVDSTVLRRPHMRRFA